MLFRSKVIESVNDDGDSGRERKGLEATFSSFTQDRAVMFESESRSGDSHLVEWTNIIILGVTIAIATAFAFISGKVWEAVGTCNYKLHLNQIRCIVQYGIFC